MAMGLPQMALAVGIRIPALYVAVSRASGWRVSPPLIVMLAVFSALLGFFMPATGILDIGGMLFRVFLFAIIIMVLMRMEFLEALGIVIFAAIIESIIILAISISPVSWLVAGMNVLTIP